MGRARGACKRAPLSACAGKAEEGAVAEPRRPTTTQPVCVMSGAQRAPFGACPSGGGLWVDWRTRPGRPGFVKQGKRDKDSSILVGLMSRPGGPFHAIELRCVRQRAQPLV